MSKLHHYKPTDAKGNSYGIEISYSFEPEQKEKGRTGPIEDSQPPYDASVTINSVLVGKVDLTAWLDSVDINWEVIETKILKQHCDE